MFKDRIADVKLDEKYSKEDFLQDAAQLDPLLKIIPEDEVKETEDFCIELLNQKTFRERPQRERIPLILSPFAAYMNIGNPKFKKLMLKSPWIGGVGVGMGIGGKIKKGFRKLLRKKEQ